MTAPAPGQPRTQPDSPPIPDEASQTRLDRAREVAGQAIDAASQAARWVAPVVGDALRQGAGVDPYEYLQRDPPELTRDQRFTSKMLQFGMRRADERVKARAGTAKK